MPRELKPGYRGSLAQRLAERFEKKFSPEPNSGCWIWTGSIDPGGRGRIRTPGSGYRRYLPATHVSLELAGKAFQESARVSHRCGLPGCVNPDHLIVGHVTNRRTRETKFRCCVVCKTTLPEEQQVTRAKYCPECFRQGRIDYERRRNISRRIPKQSLQCLECGATFMGIPTAYCDKRCPGCKYLRGSMPTRRGHLFASRCTDCGASIITFHRNWPPPPTRCADCQRQHLRERSYKRVVAHREKINERYRNLKNDPNSHAKLLLRAKRKRENLKRNPVKYGEYRQYMLEYKRQQRAALRELLANPEIVINYLKGNSHEHGNGS